MLISNSLFSRVHRGVLLILLLVIALFSSFFFFLDIIYVANVMNSLLLLTFDSGCTRKTTEV